MRRRLERVNEAVRQVVANAILLEMKDPRVQGVTVLRAEVTGDLRHAKIFVSLMGDAKQQKLTLHGLDHARGFLQSKVATCLQTRWTPAIRFVADESVKKSIAIARLLKEALGDSAQTGEEESQPADNPCPTE